MPFVAPSLLLSAVLGLARAQKALTVTTVVRPPLLDLRRPAPRDLPRLLLGLIVSVASPQGGEDTK